MSKALKAIKAAAQDSDLSKEERGKLSKVVGFLGKTGELNGVSIKFGNTDGSGGGFTSTDGLATEITLSSEFSNLYSGMENSRIPGIPNVNASVERANVLAHEAQHGIIQRSDFFNKRQTSSDDHQISAYSTGILLNKAYGTNEARGMWQSNWNSSNDAESQKRIQKWVREH